MTREQTTAAATWEPPGPGTWELDTAHYAPTVSRPIRDMVAETWETGMATGMELAGAPLSTMQARFVNGRLYRRMVPLIGGNRDLPTPPKPVLWLVTRLHPAFRRRTKRSIVALDERYWNAEHARWEAEWKPELVATNRRLGSVDLPALTDMELADHLDEVWSHVLAGGVLHFRLHSSDLGPIGLLLLRSTDLGLDPAEVMGALAGASPATSAPAVALAGIAAELVRAGVEPSTLDDVRSSGGRAAGLLDEYLAEFGDRLTGYDIRDPTLAEMPDAIVASIRNADPSESIVDHARRRGDAALDGILSQVPAADREEFTELVEDSRTLYGLRDENGPLTIEWPCGVLRHAVLEIADRLITRGRLGDGEHIFDATIAEVAAMSRGEAEPTADELADRCAERMGLPGLEPPSVLGRPMEEPDVDVLPGRMPEMMRAIQLVVALIERDDRGTEGAATTSGLSGVGVGSAPVRGIARVVADADEAYDIVEPGDIIVTRFTAPTFNAVLALAGGVVTEGGGLLCHTAVIARELGIPAVVGVPGALTEIPDGAEIEVDPVAGRVTIVAPPFAM